MIEEQVKGFTEPTSDKLLPDLHPAEQHVFTLVLDLNETIIYSDWKVKTLIAMSFHNVYCGSVDFRISQHPLTILLMLSFSCILVITHFGF
uniref:Mitochondrial import inner membrane translocase subunit TIM50-like isoform X3 n=1 Tax=Rhizophora mucronata TaxID=61149 RepID=A0A2P2KK17_RHIMU